jgi:hypothetical protein
MIITPHLNTTLHGRIYLDLFRTASAACQRMLAHSR